MCVGSVLSIILLYFVVNHQKISLMVIALFLLGFNVLPVIGHGYSFGCELVYPVNEALACGILIMFASLISTIFTFGVTILLGINKWYAVYMLFGSTVISLGFALLI
jgi:hypothetical protein